MNRKYYFCTSHRGGVKKNFPHNDTEFIDLVIDKRTTDRLKNEDSLHDMFEHLALHSNRLKKN